MRFRNFFRGFGRKAVDISPELAAYAKELGLSDAGEPVTWWSALKVTTVLACCRVRAEGLSVPFRLYHETASGRTIAKDHPLHLVLSRQPNGWQTSLEFLETISFHLDLTFNAFVFVNRVGTKREIAELIPIEPGRVEVRQNADYSLTYIVTGKGVRQEFAQDAIWHLRGPSWNSWIGLDALDLARNAVGLAKAIEKSQSDGQRNAPQTSALYSVKEKLSPDKFEFLAAWMDKHLPGGERAGKPMILDMEAAFSRLTMSAVDQQLIETRKFEIEEICRCYRVWPIMVGHAGDQSPTFASASEFFQAHKTYTLDPQYRRIAQSANINLLSEAELKEGYYTKFVANALMNAAPKDKAEYYQKALGLGGIKGWLTQNEVRDFEDMDKSDDPKADELPQPTTKAPTPSSANDSLSAAA